LEHKINHSTFEDLVFAFFEFLKQVNWFIMLFGVEKSPDTGTPFLSHMWLLTHISMVLGSNLPRLVEQTSAADENVCLAVQEEAEVAK